MRIREYTTMNNKRSYTILYIILYLLHRDEICRCRFI